MMALDFNDAEPQVSIHNLRALPCKPNTDAMRVMLSALFRDASAGLVELSWTSRAKPHPLSSARLFDLTQLDELVEMASRLSGEPNRNVYVSAGLRREDSARDKRAKDCDVFAVTAAKVDFDKAGAYEAAMDRLAAAGLLPSFVVVTGRHPYTRAQLWFVLDEPATDLAVASEIERRLAVWLEADTSITNPSRVMRLAGSVAWPLKAGRKLEMTELVTNGLRAAPYSLDELKSKVREAVPLETKPEPNIFDFNTASRQGGTSLDEYIAAAREAGRWHDSVLRAIAHLTRKGAPPDAIVSLLSHAVTQPGYTIHQTRDEIAKMVHGALQRGFVPEGEATKEATPQAEPETSSILHELWPDIDYCYEPELVEELFPQVGVATAYGESTAGKTFGVLDLVSSIAMGRQLFGRDTSPVGVLYLAFEGYRGIKKRIKGIKQEKGLQRVALELVDAPWTLSEPQGWRGLCDHIAAAKVRLEETGYPLGIVVVDTLTSAYAGIDANSQAEIAKAMKQLKRFSIDEGVLVLAIGHTGKDVTKGMAGSFAYKSESDTFIKFQADRDEATGDVVRRYVRVEKVKDGPSDYVLSDYSLREVVLGTKPNGKPITTCVVDWIIPGRNEESAAKAEQAEREQAERRDAIRLQVLDGIVAFLGDQPMAARETAIRLKEKAGVQIGRDRLVDILQSLASPRQQDTEKIPHAGATIEVQTHRQGERVTVQFRVIRDA